MIRVSHIYVLPLSLWRQRSFFFFSADIEACPAGWGAAWQIRADQCQWSIDDSGRQIVLLGLCALHQAQERFMLLLQGRYVPIRLDNLLTKAHVKHKVSTATFSSNNPFDVGSSLSGGSTGNI